MKTKIMLCTMVLLLSAFTGSVFGGTEGSSNTLFGTGAGTGLGDDEDSATFIGYQAGYNTNDGTQGYHGRLNTFVGFQAGYSNTTGYQNTVLGGEAGKANTTGSGNTFLGTVAGFSHTEGWQNSFIGQRAGYSNTTGINNTFLGESAGYNAIGSGNVFLGRSAGYNETGSNRLYIANSDTTVPLIYGEFDNRILSINGNLEVIGPYQGLVYLSNTTADSTNKVSRMVLNHYTNAELPVYLFGAASTATDNFVAFGGGNTIGNAATQIDLFTAETTTTPVGTSRLTIIGNGYVGIGTQDPLNPLEMASGAYVTTGGVWTNASSREYKDNIEALATEEAFDTLRELNPVKFAYKKDLTEKHVGFIAEDVPDLVSTKDRKGLSPLDIVAVLTKVVQEQRKEIEEQKKDYQKTISLLSGRMDELERALQLKGTLAPVK